MIFLLLLASVPGAISACSHHHLNVEEQRQIVTVTSSINDALHHNVESVRVSCDGDIDLLCRFKNRNGGLMAHPRFGPTRNSALVFSTRFPDYSKHDEMDKYLDEMLAEMMSFVTPSVFALNDEDQIWRQRPHVPVALDRDVENFMPSLPADPNGMEALDPFFDSFIYGLTLTSPVGQAAPLPDIVDKPTEMRAAGASIDGSSIEKPAELIVMSPRKEDESMENPVESVAAMEMEVDDAMEKSALAKSGDKFTDSPAEVVAVEDDEGVTNPTEMMAALEKDDLSFSKFVDAIMSRKDVQEDPIKRRFARRLSEWEQSPHRHGHFHGSVMHEDSGAEAHHYAFTEFPPLSLPFSNSAEIENCLWGHYRQNQVSSQCNAALDATKSTFLALKLQQIEDARNEEFYSQLYLLLALGSFGMILSFAILLRLSMRKKKFLSSEKFRLKRDIMAAVYSNPSIKSQVEDAIGQELGDEPPMPRWAMREEDYGRRNHGCVGRFCLLLPTLALSFLLFVTSVINPGLVLIIGVPTLCCMGVYGCIRHFCGCKSRADACDMGYPGAVAMKRRIDARHSEQIPTATPTAYIAIPVV